MTLRELLPKLEALASLIVATCLRRTVPMRRWARLLGKTYAAQPREAANPPAVEGVDRIVAVAIAGAASRLPFGTTCLDQAVAGSLMLRRRGGHPVVVIGLAREDPSCDSHAWLIGDRGGVLIGGGEVADFVPVTELR